MGQKLNNPARREHYWYKAFLLGILFSAAFFVPYMVIGHGYFLYYGDFNVQQVPFYQMVHDTIREGNLGWSITTDLGSSWIGSYTFYLLTSPFFWLTLPFPSEFVPYMMGPLLILKFGSASLTSYIYLRRYVRNKNIAVLGGILYAFSGFAVYNVFFNHFHEAIVFFPLLLAAIDEYMETKRRGVVALAVFWACFVNYYFFVGMVAFVIIYWFIKMYMDCWRIKSKEFFALAFEVAVGFAATAIMLVPTVLFVTQNPRVNDAPIGWGTLLYDNEQRYMHIFTSMFFPPDIPARPNFTPDSNSKWASIAAWLPMFGMTGVIGFLQNKSKGWLKKFLPFLMLATVVPILNSIFQMFVMTYYARWFYMLTLMYSLATVIAVENSKTKWKKSITFTTIITVAIALGIGLMPNGNSDTDKKLEMVGLENYRDRFWVYVAIAMVSLAVVTVLISVLKKDKKKFYIKAMACLGVISVVYSGYLIGLGKSHSYDIDNFVIPYCLNNGKDITLDDDFDNIRVDFYDSMDNMGMFWQMPTIQAFQSVVPGSIYEFYPTLGVARDVGSRAETEPYAIRSLLSVKYLFDDATDSNNFANDEGKTKMPGYKYIDTQNGFKIYENKYYLPYGFYFDKYITEDQYYSLDEDLRHLLLMKAIVLTDEQANRFGSMMTHIVSVKSLKYDEKTYKTDCTQLADNVCSSFKYGKSSFEATITPPAGKDRLVFFSVPFENGWSAEINGEPAQIEKVDIGFMAVRVSGGVTSNISFKYQTPGLRLGAMISAGSLFLFVVYLLISKKRNLLGPKVRMKKSYKVYAIGSADELGDRYRDLVAGRKPMKKKYRMKPAGQTGESAETEAAAESPENTESISEQSEVRNEAENNEAVTSGEDTSQSVSEEKSESEDKVSDMTEKTEEAEEKTDDQKASDKVEEEPYENEKTSKKNKSGKRKSQE